MPTDCERTRTGPKRGEGTWDEFITRHAKTLWARDFFSAKTRAMRSVVEIDVLLFIHVGSRRVHVAGIGTNPDQVWSAQATRNMSMAFADQPDRPTHLIRDLDSKFGPAFDAILESDEIEVVKVGPKKPNLNPFVERLIGSIRRDLLDHVIVLNERYSFVFCIFRGK